MINVVEIPSMANNYKNKYGDNLLYINNFNKINIFIGENNSGKSRMLRYIINGNDTKALSKISEEEQKNKYIKAKSNLLTNIKKFNYENRIKIEIPDEFNTFDECNYYVEVYYYIENMHINKDELNLNQKQYFLNIKNSLNEMYKCLLITKGYNPIKVNEYDITYIPILRGAESFNIYYQLKETDELNTIALNKKQKTAMDEYKDNAKHIYSNKVSQVYAIDNNKIFTAENLFDDVKNKLLGEEVDRKFIREFENFISEEFYENKEFTIIPKINEGVIYVKIGKTKERALHNLGDGIKQLITILYKIYEKKDKKAIFCIEEPEINLHPGYQRQFLQIIQQNKHFSQHQFFITTHSNHFIDNCLNYDNTSIYKFINIEKRNDLFKVINTSNNDIEILDLLGVYNSSVFVSNCTIWVEGISDKILISKYLQVYLKDKKEYSYREDINYSFVEYDGNNIDHWTFIDDENIATINASGITNRSFIVCDNDADGKPKRKANLKRVFGEERFYELKVREIENTVSRKVLESSLFPNSKPEFIKEYRAEKYATKKTYMGDFIDQHYKLNKSYSNRTKSTNKGTGTIRDKLSFAKNVSSNITDINDLSESALDLCEKIYNFIKKSNN